MIGNKIVSVYYTDREVKKFARFFDLSSKDVGRRSDDFKA